MARKEILVNSQEDVEKNWDRILYPMITTREEIIAHRPENMYLDQREIYMRAIYELIAEGTLPILTHHLSE